MKPVDRPKWRNAQNAMKAGVVLALVGLTGATTDSAAWGRDGHFIVGEAAAAGLPENVPAFFREAADRLAYLNYEPDRWRDRELREMDQAFQYDHYIDLENVPEAARRATDRFEYLTVLFRETELAVPQRDAGLLPFRILELYQRLTTGFARWRSAEDAVERSWIEERIINDAGVLGHYVADGAQPHHTTIHFNGWSASAPNPQGYTVQRDFHARFESAFVSANIEADDVIAEVSAGSGRLGDVHDAVWSYLLSTFELVVPLYELEKEHGFRPERPTAETESFAVDRLVAAATMLRALWYTAWIESGG